MSGSGPRTRLRHWDDAQQIAELVCHFWPNESERAMCLLITELARACGRTVDRLMREAERADIERFLDGLPESAQPEAKRRLQRLFFLAEAEQVRSRSPLAIPRPMPPALALLSEAGSAEAAAILSHMGGGRTRSTRGEYRRAVGRWTAWAIANKYDPVRAMDTAVLRYLAAIAVDGEVPWTDLSSLRRFFLNAVAAGLRATNPLPYQGQAGLMERADDPLRDLAKRTIRSYRPKTRASASSLLTEYVELVRAKDLDPINLSPAGFRALIPAARVPRLRGVVQRFLDQAAEQGKLGPLGAQLRLQLRARTAAGHRRILVAYRAWAKKQGYREAGAVPIFERERYLSGLLAEGQTVADVAAARSAIIGIEHRAQADGLRPDRSDRAQRLIARLMLLGLTEDEAAVVLDAFLEGLKPSSHRSMEAALVRYLEYARRHQIDPTNPSDAELLSYEKAELTRNAAGKYASPYHYLRLLPVRRFAAAMNGIGRFSSRAAMASLGQRKSRRLLSAAAAEGVEQPEALAF